MIGSRVRDAKTKRRFAEYIKEHPDERFFQAIRNFTAINLDKNVFTIEAVKHGIAMDTFYWECDSKLKEEA